MNLSNQPTYNYPPRLIDLADLAHLADLSRASQEADCLVVGNSGILQLITSLSLTMQRIA
jgi:hypothetical protein